MSLGHLIAPGLTLCGRCRRRDAELVYTDPAALTRRAAEPELLCFDCLELELERERARAINPRAATLEAIAAGELERPYHLDDATERLLEKASTPRAVQRARRCHAIRPDGTRCVRAATVAGRYSDAPYVCDTCADAHRPTPGLGWTDDGEPRGNLRPFARAL